MTEWLDLLGKITDYFEIYQNKIYYFCDTDKLLNTETVLSDCLNFRKLCHAAFVENSGYLIETDTKKYTFSFLILLDASIITIAVT